MFLQTLIDDYITPMVGQSSPDFSGFIRALITMAVIYLIGTLSTLIYNRRMVTIAQERSRPYAMRCLRRCSACR